MIKDMQLYGDIVPFKYFDESPEIDLAYLNSEIARLDLKKGDTLRIGIHSFGGCTTTAFGMFNILRRLSNVDGIRIITRIDGYCCSSGVILLLAGDERIGNEYAEPFIHKAWTYVVGNENEVQKVMEDLKRVDNMIAELYSKRTKMDKQVALDLMSADTWLTVEQCKEYEFYTEVENIETPVNKEVFNSLTKIRKNENKNNSTMANRKPAPAKNSARGANKKNEISEKGLFEMMRNYFRGNNKIMFTASDEEVDFYELGTDDTPQVGDKATIGGEPAGDTDNGEILMKSGETYVFEGEVLKEIKPKDENDDDTENDDDSEEIENLKEENAELTNKYNALRKKYNVLRKKKEEGDAILNRLQGVSKTQLNNLINGVNDDEEDDDDDEEDDDDDEEDDDEEDDDDDDDNGFDNSGGFPQNKKKARVSNSGAGVRNSKATKKDASTRNIISNMNANLFKKKDA